MSSSEVENILSLEYFKKRRDPNSKVHYFEEVWMRKPKSVKEEKYKNMEPTDLRWTKGKLRGRK